MNKRFKALDSFRGLCAISVVMFHIHIIGSITELDFFRGSSIFVEFFFVLSGFVLTHSYGFKDNINFKSFMRSRFFRLYPLHFTMFLLVFISQVIKTIAYKYSGLNFNVEPFTGNFSINEIVPNLLLIQSWTSFTEPLSYNYPSWSISIEFYMYALLFLSIVIFKSNRVISWLSVSLISFVLIFLGSDLLTYSVLTGLSCFFGGAVTYVIYNKISNLKPSYLLGSVAELLLLLLALFVVQSKFECRSIIAPVLFFFIVLFFAFESGICSQLLKIKPLQYAGKLSYSIYMTHGVVLIYLGSILKVIDRITSTEMLPQIGDITYMNFGSDFINNIITIFLLLFIIYISSLTYKYIELSGQKLKTI